MRGANTASTSRKPSSTRPIWDERMRSVWRNASRQRLWDFSVMPVMARLGLLLLEGALVGRVDEHQLTRTRGSRNV